MYCSSQRLYALLCTSPNVFVCAPCKHTQINRTGKMTSRPLERDYCVLDMRQRSRTSWTSCISWRSTVGLVGSGSWTSCDLTRTHTHTKKTEESAVICFDVFKRREDVFWLRTFRRSSSSNWHCWRLQSFQRTDDVSIFGWLDRHYHRGRALILDSVHRSVHW